MTKNELDILARLKAEHRALAIIEALEAELGYRLSAHLLWAFMREIALGGTGEEMEATFASLEKNGLVALEDTGQCIVAALTRKGAEVARGERIVEGVRRPPPKR